MKFAIVAVASLAIFAVVFAHDGHDHSHDRHKHEVQYSRTSCNHTAARECDPDNHDLHCHDPADPSIHLCIGESVPLPKCRQMTCVHYDGDVALIRGCHDVTTNDPKCKVVKGDPAKDYPFCCDYQVCE